MNVTTTALPLETVLTNEWDTELADSIHRFGPLGTLTCTEVIELLRTTKADEQRDHILITLLDLNHAGMDVAGKVVIRAFMPLALGYARTSAATRDLYRHSRFDATDTVLAAFWEVVATYPVEARRTSVAGNLRGRMMKALRGFGSHVGVEYNTSDEYLEDLVNGDAQEPEEDALEELRTLFTWAIDTEVLTRDEVVLLVKIELAETDPGQAREDAAAELGITRETLNKRVYRIRNKLIQAVCGDIQTKVKYAPRRKAA